MMFADFHCCWHNDSFVAWFSASFPRFYTCRPSAQNVKLSSRARLEHGASILSVFLIECSLLSSGAEALNTYGTISILLGSMEIRHSAESSEIKFRSSMEMAANKRVFVSFWLDIRALARKIIGFKLDSMQRLKWIDLSWCWDIPIERGPMRASLHLTHRIPYFYCMESWWQRLN